REILREDRDHHGIAIRSMSIHAEPRPSNKCRGVKRQKFRRTCAADTGPLADSVKDLLKIRHLLPRALMDRVTQRDTYSGNSRHIVPAIDSHQVRKSTPYRHRAGEKNDR